MKNKKILAIVLIGVLSISAFAFGANGVQKIEAYLVGDLNFEVDGEEWMPKDVDGSPLTPIIYKDRTYVPVRSLLEDKGVTVGFNDETRTVLLDYSTFKRLDKSTPLLYQGLKSSTNADDSTVNVEKVELALNPNYEPTNLARTQEYNFDLKDDATIYVDGKELEGNLEEIYKSEMMWSMKSIELDIDKESGMTNEVRINTLSDSAADQELAAKLDVDVTISYPPFKVTIVISF